MNMLLRVATVLALITAGCESPGSVTGATGAGGGATTASGSGGAVATTASGSGGAVASSSAGSGGGTVHHGPFTCGSQPCDSATHYCAWNQVEGMPDADTYTCEQIPAACLSDSSCACLTAAVPSPGETCIYPTWGTPDNMDIWCLDDGTGLRTCTIEP